MKIICRNTLEDISTQYNKDHYSSQYHKNTTYVEKYNYSKHIFKWRCESLRISFKITPHPVQSTKKRKGTLLCRPHEHGLFIVTGQELHAYSLKWKESNKGLIALRRTYRNGIQTVLEFDVLMTH